MILTPSWLWARTSDDGVDGVWRLKVHDVQARIVVGAVDQSVRIDEDVGRLDDTVTIDPMIDEARGVMISLLGVGQFQFGDLG